MAGNSDSFLDYIIIYNSIDGIIPPLILVLDGFTKWRR